MIVIVHIFSLTGKSVKCVGTKGSLAPHEGLLFILTPTRSKLQSVIITTSKSSMKFAAHLALAAQAKGSFCGHTILALAVQAMCMWLTLATTELYY